MSWYGLSLLLFSTIYTVKANIVVITKIYYNVLRIP
jgi:hypothetical protein